MTSVILKRDGFYKVKSVKNNETDEWEQVEKLVDTKGESSPSFFALWNKPLTIADGVLTGDLFRILHQMDPAALTMVELLTDSNWKDSLKEAFDPVEKVDKDPLFFVEVYKHMEVGNLHDLRKFELDSEYTCAHGIGKPWEGEGMADVPVEERGTVYAIEFTPWNELRNVPLRIKEKMYFGYTVYEQGERRKMVSNGGDEDWNFFDKDRNKEKSKDMELGYTMTLGEFLGGLANEICFFGGPDDRKEEKQKLTGIMESVEESLKNEKN